MRQKNDSIKLFFRCSTARTIVLRLRLATHFFFRDPKSFKVILSYLRKGLTALSDAGLEVPGGAQHDGEAIAPSTPWSHGFLLDRADPVRINVDGTMFSTSIPTLRSIPGSVIADLFQEGDRLASAEKDETGAYLLDW